MKRWWMGVAAATVMSCFSTLWGADSIVAVTTVTNVSSLTGQLVDFAEVSGCDKIKAAAYGVKVFTEQPLFTEAIDTTRPAGGLVWIAEGERRLRRLLILPVKSPIALEKMLPGSWKVTNDENGMLQITVPKGGASQQVFYAVEYESWLILSESRENFPVGWESWQVDEARRLFEEGVSRRDLGATLYINRLPVEIRREGMKRLMEAVRKGLEKNRAKWGEEVIDSLLGKMDRLMQKAETAGYVSPVETLSWSLDWDEDADTLNLRLEAVAAENSLGEEWHAFASPARTTLGTFDLPEALFSSQVSLSLPFLTSKEVHQLAERYWEGLSQKVREHTVSPEMAGTIEKFIRQNTDSWEKAFLTPNLEEGFCVSLSQEKPLVMWGRTVPNSDVLEKQFQQIIDFVKQQENDELREKIVESGKDVEGSWHLYYMTFALPENDSCKHASLLRSICGTTIQGCVVFAPETIYYAIGKHAKSDLLAFLKSDAAQPATVPVFQWNLRVRKLLEFLANHEHNEDTRIQIKAALKKMGDTGTGTVSWKLVPLEKGLGLEIQATSSAIQMFKGI